MTFNNEQKDVLISAFVCFIQMLPITHTYKVFYRNTWASFGSIAGTLLYSAYMGMLISVAIARIYEGEILRGILMLLTGGSVTIYVFDNSKA